jgi:protein-export membrane protein SecD
VTLAAAGVMTAVVTDSSPTLGLDLQGGISVVLAPAEDEDTDDMGERLDQAVEIIRQRVDGLGVAEPEISRRGDNIVVDLPGVDDRDRVLELLGSTAELRFRPVLSQVTSEVFNGEEEDEAANGVEAPADEEQELTPPEADEPAEQVILEDKDGANVYTLGPMQATGQIVEDAQASLDEVGQWYVGLTFRTGEEGLDLFNQAATLCFSGGAECPTSQLAIVLDSEVQSAPQINEPTYDRRGATISGEFGEREAKDLALVLRYGALPVELERQSVQTVSASVGDDALRAGIIAGLIGLVLVGLYMVVYYRALGVVVIVGLGLWASLMYAVVSWLGTTQGLALTLAGVTGIIISIGVTVDSYVVYFERLKDEVKLGRTLRTSTDRAFKRAFKTVVAASTSTLIGAAVLWWLTVGAVRGFAFFLGLSSLLGLLVMATFTRSAVNLLARNHFISQARGFGLESALSMSPERAKAEAGAAS